MFKKLECLEELWLLFGTGSDCDIYLHQVVAERDDYICPVLPMFRVLTGVTVFPHFVVEAGIQHRRCANFTKATHAVETLFNMPAKLNDSAITTIKQFMLLFYE